MSEPNAKLTEQFRRGGWLIASGSRDVLDHWINHSLPDLERQRGTPLHPVIQELKDMIDNDADMYMFENATFVSLFIGFSWVFRYPC
jgi:hypothetical protein